MILSMFYLSIPWNTLLVFERNLPIKYEIGVNLLKHKKGGIS